MKQMKTMMITLAGLLLLAGCSVTASEGLPGSWRVTKKIYSGGDEVEYPDEYPYLNWNFADNGTFAVVGVFSSSQQTTSWHGEWTLVGEDLLNLTDNNYPCLSYTIAEITTGTLVLEFAGEQNGCQSPEQKIYFERN